MGGGKKQVVREGGATGQVVGCLKQEEEEEDSGYKIGWERRKTNSRESKEEMRGNEEGRGEESEMNETVNKME